ncbi:NAD(P)-dependent oxidoreductase [Streptomyces iakyrus]|uniref:NAD(P)-dependent oxidoreductase n=1 Tax=Streptomyces iakyrus TaxID=68219 RepID=UPI0036796CC9
MGAGFGATGGVGQEIVRQALTAGHQVTAIVRDPARLTVTGAGLDVFRADLAGAEALRPAVTGWDAVSAGLGARSRKHAGDATRLTRTVLDAMEAEGVRRLPAISAAPIGPVPEGDAALDRVARGIVSRIYKDVYADLRAMEAAIRVAVGGTPPKARSPGRADVAHAMLAMVGDATTVKQGVGLASRG